MKFNKIKLIIYKTMTIKRIIKKIILNRSKNKTIMTDFLTI